MGLGRVQNGVISTPEAEPRAGGRAGEGQWTHKHPSIDESLAQFMWPYDCDAVDAFGAIAHVTRHVAPWPWWYHTANISPWLT